MRKKKIKIYPLEKSPFYGLNNKPKLADLLFIEQKNLSILKSDKLYNAFSIKTGSKRRDIQEPIGIRSRVHGRIQQLMSRIETPDYLFSGKKGLCSLDNAKKHILNHYFLTADIDNFYPNSKREYIFRFYYYQMKMSEDIAWLMADMVCYDDHIPTGSQLSQSIAYWAYRKTFNKISDFAHQRKLKFTLYVDDMTFSGSLPIRQDLHLSINYYLKTVGLKLKKGKTKYYSKNKFKKITGAVISPANELLIPNKHRKKLKELKDRYNDLKKMPPNVVRSFLGQLRYTRQIQNDYYQQPYVLLREVEKKLNRT